MLGVMDESRLKKMRPFADLSIEDLGLLSRFCEEYEAPAGTTLVAQGDFGYEFIVIEEGTAEVVRDGERIDAIDAGDFFGELATLEPGALRNASVVASSPVRIVAITAHNMRMLRERMPVLAEQIDAVVVERTH